MIYLLGTALTVTIVALFGYPYLKIHPLVRVILMVGAVSLILTIVRIQASLPVSYVGWAQFDEVSPPVQPDIHVNADIISAARRKAFFDACHMWGGIDSVCVGMSEWYDKKEASVGAIK